MHSFYVKVLDVNLLYLKRNGRKLKKFSFIFQKQFEKIYFQQKTKSCKVFARFLEATSFLQDNENTKNYLNILTKLVLPYKISCKSLASKESKTAGVIGDECRRKHFNFFFISMQEAPLKNFRVHQT